MELFRPEPILVPVLALVAWTLVMQAWLIIARIPAMRAAGLDAQDAQRTADLAARMPPQAQWKADNYNHLMEQPTIFYATALALALAGLGDGLYLWLAWFYVASRVVHSLVHATTNVVMLRLGVFALGTFALLIMVAVGIVDLL